MKNAIVSKFFVLVILIFMVIFFVSCSTSVNMDVTRPANLDIEKYSSISALPFRTTSEMGSYSRQSSRPIYTFDDFLKELGRRYLQDSDELDILHTFDKRLANRLRTMNNFDYVDPKTVESAIYYNTRIPVDVYITGGFTEFSSSIEEEIVEREDKNGNKYKEKRYWREVSFSILYQVVDANNYYVITSNEKSYSASSSKENSELRVDSALSLVNSKLNNFISLIMHDFQPYVVTKTLTMLKHKDEEMKQTAKLVDDGQYVLAKNRYLALYESKNYFEAGYNAVLLWEAIGNYDEALSLMTQIYKETGNPQAKNKINDLVSEIESNERLKKQLNK